MTRIASENLDYYTIFLVSFMKTVSTFITLENRKNEKDSVLLLYHYILDKKHKKQIIIIRLCSKIELL